MKKNYVNNLREGRLDHVLKHNFSHFFHENAVCVYVRIDMMSADGPLINLIIITLFGVARHRLISIQIQSIFHGLFVAYALLL